MDYPRFIADPRRATDQDVDILRRHALRSILPVAPVFGEWLHAWTDQEQYWRSTDPEKRPAQHLAAVPPCEEWTDRDLGDALNVMIQVHFLAGTPEIVGEWLDRWLKIVAGHAACRLAGALPRVSDNDGT